jgi:hypothetical protein
LASLSRGVNSPLPVSGGCEIERCGFGNSPRTQSSKLFYMI